MRVAISLGAPEDAADAPLSRRVVALEEGWLLCSDRSGRERAHHILNLASCRVRSGVGCGLDDNLCVCDESGGGDGRAAQ